jgi:acetyl-CoA synthetase
MHKLKLFKPFTRDSDGHYQITGRVDDVINVTGHRLGTAEVEDALV